MPSFGPNSTRHLQTCDPRLQDVLNEAIKHYDFSVIDGFRDEGRQDRYYEEGVTKVRWPNSKHNSYPSRAVDIVPYPGGFKNPDEEFFRMATYILSAAATVGVALTWGGHWKNFKDLPHFELKD